MICSPAVTHSMPAAVLSHASLLYYTVYPLLICAHPGSAPLLQTRHGHGNLGIIGLHRVIVYQGVVIPIITLYSSILLPPPFPSLPYPLLSLPISSSVYPSVSLSISASTFLVSRQR